jgi:hypothetical protein
MAREIDEEERVGCGMRDGKIHSRRPDGMLWGWEIIVGWKALRAVGTILGGVLAQLSGPGATRLYVHWGLALR